MNVRTGTIHPDAPFLPFWMRQGAQPDTAASMFHPRIRTQEIAAESRNFGTAIWRL